MSNELVDLNRQANQQADLLEAVACKLRADDPWSLELDEVDNWLVPGYAARMPGPGGTMVLIMRRNKLLMSPHANRVYG